MRASLLIAVALLLPLSGARAEDPCAEDVKQFCAEVKPGGGRVYSGGTNTGSGPSEPTPAIFTSAIYGTITPGSSTVFDFDLCGGVNVNNNCTPATTITSIEFSGQISPSILSASTT